MFFSNKDRTRYKDRAGASKRQLDKSDLGKTIEAKELIEDNVKQANALLTLAEGKPCYDELAALIKKMSFFNPCPERDVTKKDEKISAKLGDLKIKLISEKDKTEDIAELMKELKILIAERSALE